ncbi:MAG: single-stranded DNA-binding protein [Cyanobacteria bacterium J06635_1]
MASVGLNKWVVSGNLAADAEVKTVEVRSGKTVQVAEATIYVRDVKNREASFTVALTIWEDSAAWRKLPFLKKGSLIICTGSVNPSPYISKKDNAPKAGLKMSVLDIDLDVIRNFEEDSSAMSQANPKRVAAASA